ncbi:MAG TPA: hypothetical protein VMZ03_05205 [Chitinophagaceae bacterium]|nr:hypothetical protein [Chitinophagaceae bacterium]
MNGQQQIGDCDKLIDAFITIGNKMAGTNILPSEEYLYNVEGLGKKILNHTITSRVLLEGYQLKNYEPQIDFCSIAVLTRASLETYLALHHIFIAPQNEDEKIFKLKSWYLGGLDRVKFKPAFKGILQKWEKENQHAETLRAEIVSTQYYQQLSPKSQERVLKGEWKLEGWSQLARAANFNEKYFRKIYSYLCRYAHSNRQSIIQIQQMPGLDKQREMALAFIGMAMVVLAKYAFDYIEIMPELKKKTDFSSNEYKIILQYKNIAELLNDDTLRNSKA